MRIAPPPTSLCVRGSSLRAHHRFDGLDAPRPRTRVRAVSFRGDDRALELLEDLLGIGDRQYVAADRHEAGAVGLAEWVKRGGALQENTTRSTFIEGRALDRRDQESMLADSFP